jgi:hypothetical protein
MDKQPPKIVPFFAPPIISTPFPTPDKYIEMMEKQRGSLPIFGPINKVINRYLDNRLWKSGGHILSWFHQDCKFDERCLLSRALIRGDGKILGKINTEYSLCFRPDGYNAKVENGHLVGITTDGYKFGDIKDVEKLIKEVTDINNGKNDIAAQEHHTYSLR